ncbi:MAG: hypothetical protein LBS86_05345 [Treponema sp.]|nr:hypothetical protein [Treponema sp.]
MDTAQRQPQRQRFRRRDAPGTVKPINFSDTDGFDESIEWESGFYKRFRFTQPGTYAMAFRFDYTFYYVNFEVK